MVNEIWKDVVGYEDRYQISNIGGLRSKDIVLSKTDGKKELRKGKILKLNRNQSGYFTHLMSKGAKCKRKNIPIHRLVATAFIPNPDNKPCIDHINTIVTDNRVENLRWCTYSENNRNPITMTKYRNKMTGFKHSAETKIKIGLAGLGRITSEETKEKHRAKGWKVVSFTKDGVFYKKFASPYYASLELKASKLHISACCNGVRKSTGGFMWKWEKDWNGGNIEPYKINRPTTTARKTMPASWLENVRKSRMKFKKKVFVYDLNNNFICECSSTREAARKFNTNSGSVCRVCNGKIKHSKGFIFKYDKYD